MKRSKKKLIMKITSVAAAAAMTFSVGALAASADKTVSSSGSASDSSEQRAMKDALTAVKKRITVPSQISEFEYNVSEQYGNEGFYFTWTTPDDAETYERVDVTIVQNIIASYTYTSYSKDENSSGSPSFAKLSNETLIKKAEEYSAQLNPDIEASDFVVGSVGLYNNQALVSFGRTVNGVDVPDNSGNIVLDKDTGELISYTLSGWYYDGTSFTSPKSALSRSDAWAKYTEYTTLTPSYRIVSTWNEKTEEYDQSPVLIYTPSYAGDIDAVTGKQSAMWDDMNADKGTTWFPFQGGAWYAEDAETTEDADFEDAGAANPATGVIFTEEELREINADESLLTKDEITSLLKKDKYIALPEYASLSNSYLTKLSDGSYRYEMSYDAEKGSDKSYWLTVALDAESGKVEYFYCGSGDTELDDSKAYPVKSSAAVADAVIKYYYPEIYSEYKADESNLAASSKWTSKNGKTTYETVRYFTYSRYVNGVKVEGDNIMVRVDNQGNVTNVTYEYTDVEFPSSVPAFDSDKAFASIYKQLNISLYYSGYYKPDGTVKTYLLYSISDYYVNSSYKLVDYYGEEISQSASGNITDDVSGIKQEKAIRTLERYGITLDYTDGRFEPNKAITKSEFLQLLRKAQRSYRASCTDEEGSKAITRKEAAKLFTDNLGLSDAAKLKGIFKSPFSDVSEDDEYVGYIAIASASGFMSGGTEFKPDKKISRAQAMQMIYDYILSFGK